MLVRFEDGKILNIGMAQKICLEQTYVNDYDTADWMVKVYTNQVAEILVTKTTEAEAVQVVDFIFESYLAGASAIDLRNTDAEEFSKDA